MKIKIKNATGQTPREVKTEHCKSLTLSGSDLIFGTMKDTKVVFSFVNAALAAQAFDIVSACIEDDVKYLIIREFEDSEYCSSEEHFTIPGYLIWTAGDGEQMLLFHHN